MVLIEDLARALHEAGRAAVAAGKVVNRVAGQPFLEWSEITADARDGRRIQARWLIDHGWINSDGPGGAL